VALEDLLQSQSGREGRQNCNRYWWQIGAITMYNFGFRLPYRVRVSHITTDCHSVCLSWYRARSGAHDQIFIHV
jgi:hypothetical protein